MIHEWALSLLAPALSLMTMTNDAYQFLCKSGRLYLILNMKTHHHRSTFNNNNYFNFMQCQESGFSILLCSNSSGNNPQELSSRSASHCAGSILYNHHIFIHTEHTFKNLNTYYKRGKYSAHSFAGLYFFYIHTYVFQLSRGAIDFLFFVQVGPWGILSLSVQTSDAESDSSRESCIPNDLVRDLRHFQTNLT
jgi:hypothetical protein